MASPKNKGKGRPANDSSDEEDDLDEDSNHEAPSYDFSKSPSNKSIGKMADDILDLSSDSSSDESECGDS